MDEYNILSAFTQLRINEEAPTLTGQSTSFYHDEVIRNIQREQLIEARLEDVLAHDHEIFLLVEDLHRRWSLSMQAAQNFMSLAKGNLKFPFILLQNPCTGHDVLKFEDMVDQCDTLRWIQDVLRKEELDFDDVVILDVCLLFIDQWIRGQPQEHAAMAIRDAYDVIEQILGLLKPAILISCQCVTAPSQYRLRKTTADTPSTMLKVNASPFVQMLGSLLNAAKVHEIFHFRYLGHKLNVVKAYHPSSFINFIRRAPGDAETQEQGLQAILSHFLKPCGRWKAQNVVLLMLYSAISQFAEDVERSTLALKSLSDDLHRLSAKVLSKRALLRDGAGGGVWTT